MDRETSASHDMAPVTAAVGAEMAAIFGSARRDDAAPPSRFEPPKRGSHRRGLIAATAAVVAIAVGAGSVFVGQSVVGNPVLARPSAPRASGTSPFRMPSPPPIPVAPVSANEDLAYAAPTTTSAATGSIDRSAEVTPSSPAAAIQRDDDVPNDLPSAVQPVRPPVDAAPDRVALADPAPLPPGACDDDSDGCVQVRLDAAERQLAGAYRDAAASGVRARDLRDYRGEWMRARRQAAFRPRAALRVYDMILADLDTLTDDAAARARFGQR